jgi:hypothetical protein
MKLPLVKTIENRVWILAKQIIRKTYGIDKCYICGVTVTELKKLHTGHLFKKGSLPVQLKYDLRLLRPCCATCNLFKDGNESWYCVKIIENEGVDYLMSIVHDIRNTKDIKSIPERREFLLSLEQEYDTLLSSYQRMAKPVS